MKCVNTVKKTIDTKNWAFSEGDCILKSVIGINIKIIFKCVGGEGIVSKLVKIIFYTLLARF